MACAAGTTTYYLEAIKDIKDQPTANSTTVPVCTATKILDRLHREFTEQYVEVPHRDNRWLREEPRLTLLI